MWFIPLLILLAMMLWLLWLRRERSDASMTVFRGKYIDEKISPVDIINIKREKAGK